MKPLHHTNNPTSSLLNGSTSYNPKSDPRREKRSLSNGMHQRRPLLTTPADCGLRILSLLLSLTIISILAYTFIIHRNTKDDNITSPHGYRLRAWLTRLKLYPTYILLVAAVAAAALNLAVMLTMLCGVSCAPRRSSRNARKSQHRKD